MPGRRVAWSRAQHRQALIQQGQQSCRREDRRTGRGQLDGQGQAVQPLTDRGHVPSILLIQCKVRRRRPARVARTDATAGALRTGSSRVAPASRDGKRGHGQDLLPPHMQRRPAGGQHLQRGTTGQQDGDQIAAAASTCSQLSRRSSRCSERRCATRASVAEPCAPTSTPNTAANVAATSPGSASGERSTNVTPSANDATMSAAMARAEPCLAHPARSGQGQQRNGILEQKSAGRGDLRLPPDEARAGDGQRTGEVRRCAYSHGMPMTNRLTARVARRMTGSAGGVKRGVMACRPLTF